MMNHFEVGSENFENKNKYQAPINTGNDYLIDQPEGQQINVNSEVT